MHIVFLTHYFPPEGNAPATRTYEHCVRWVRRGHDVTVITCAPNVPNGLVYEGYRNAFRPQSEIVDGIRVIRVWTWLAANVGVSRRSLNYISYLVSALTALLFTRRPDVIVATSPQFFCGWAGVLGSYLRWCPLVLEIRDIWPESITTVGAMQKGLLVRILETLERWMYRAATHIVTVGNGYRDNIQQKVLRQKNISVVTNGIDAATVVPSEKDRAFLRQWGFDDRFVCAYVGTIGMAHGLEVIVQAARRLANDDRHDVGFLIVGDGARRKAIQEMVESEQVTEYVQFTGQVPKSAVRTAVASADALLVHLRDSELFHTVIPSKMFEGLAMARPIIMAVPGEASQILRASGNGICIEPEQPEQLLEAIDRLKDDPQRCEEMGVRGREFVKANFDRDVLAERYLKIISAVVAGEPVTEEMMGTKDFRVTTEAGVSVGR